MSLDLAEPTAPCCGEVVTECRCDDCTACGQARCVCLPWEAPLSDPHTRFVLKLDAGDMGGSAGISQVAKNRWLLRAEVHGPGGTMCTSQSFSHPEDAKVHAELWMANAVNNVKGLK